MVLISALVGLPIWYFSTSIHRARLPEEQIDQLNDNLLDRINYEVPIYLLDLPEALDGLLEETQTLIDSEVTKIEGIHAHIKLYKGRSDQVDKHSYKIKLITLGPESDDLEESVYISPKEDRLTKIFLSPEVISNGLVSDFITRVVTGDLLALNRNQGSHNSLLRIPYSPKCKVSLSFLEEGDDPIEWDIKPIVKKFEKYLSSVLGEYANFTVESQMGYYESLLDTANLEADQEEEGTLILKDTSTFIDYSEWGLDQDVEVIPSINLVVYVPNSDKKIRIENSVSNSFIVPQWGGIVIHNQEGKNDTLMSTKELAPIFDIFASQIFHLLGAPETPKSPFIRADIMTRSQCVENLVKSMDNLISLSKLTEQLPTIPIPEITLKEVDESMRLVNESISVIEGKEERWWKKANQLSAKALELSDKAFFQKDMVQQVYFPDEHKMAIYMPLLGPFGTIILLGVLRMVRESTSNRATKLRTKSEVN
ncbi:DEKNAAC104356 [Brettanomyces naardenensis]|uniref:DEKNAAC104356 n=1 Tax=Brettanomyces naardenensis TaxID=13370 RepID=A0A448YQU4_BRENA|nr:DEKNAAC104356 [Brettanomyces naardenensis]